MAGTPDMGAFWDARAREDAFYFVDNEQTYGRPDQERFWADGERVVDAFCERLGLALPAGGRAVDIGCGLGRLTRALAGRVAHVHGVDVSADMLARARELNAHLENVTWHRGDGTTLPLPDAVADVVLSHVVFQHLPDPELTYGYVREIGRVLRPGGVAGFQVSNDPAIHRPGRRRSLLRRGPEGQDDPRWVGSAVELDRLHAAAAEGGCDVTRTEGEGTQFCLVGLERRS